VATVNVQRIAGGDLGALQTISRMRQLVNSSLTDPAVIQTARSVVALCPPRDINCRAQSIREWLSDHFQFENDPRGVELITTPRYLLDRIAARYYAQGDCDDAAILGAALGKAVGLRARFVILGFHRPAAPYSHVFTILRGAGVWHSLDVTKPARGPFPPVSRSSQVEV
jgi:transglutaminase-like putative cysteine protease